MELQRHKSTPIDVVRSRRVQELRGITSLPAGKMVPITYIPLLREDSCQANLRLSFEMRETVEVLMNAVNVCVKAYLVPHLALERFDGMDALNRSYEGIEAYSGGPVTSFIETIAFGAHSAVPIYKYLGLHGQPTDQINSAVAEAYNQIWNYRARNRSPDLALRSRLAGDLAPAFWKQAQFWNIVPDFDQAVIDGEVALNITEANMPVKGIGSVVGGGTVLANSGNVMEAGETGFTQFPYFKAMDDGGAVVLKVKNTGEAQVFAELQENGVTVSLSNIELAKRTAAFAQLRKQFTGIEDDYILDLLMDGISIPDQQYENPILVGKADTVFGMSKRHATDSGNLTDSVVEGATYVDLAINVPKVNPGGVIMVVAEITPEQLYERQRDPYFHAQTVDDFPQYLRDELDPEKVSVVPNGYIDTDHSDPTGTFGYAPLNHEWQIMAPRVGGRFYRPTVDAAFDEDRQRIWAVEAVDPVLGEDFYLATTIHQKPFEDTVNDPFEVVVSGDAIIRGNTVFGGVLHEATSDYADVLAEAPVERIDKA